MASLGFDDFLSKTKDWLKTRASIDLDDANTIPILTKNMKKTSLMFFFIFISGYIIYSISTDKEGLSTKLYYYLILIFIPIIIGSIVGKEFFVSQNEGSYEPFLKGASLLFFLFIIIYGLKTVISAPSSLVFMNYFINIMLILIILTGLAIVYFIFSNYIKQQTGSIGLFARILFYVPCLFADFVNYIKKELSITPNVVYILLLMEILFIVLYAYLPQWVNRFIKMNSHVLLNEPVDLNIENTIASSRLFVTSKLEEIDESGRKNKILEMIRKWTGAEENELYKYPTYRDNNYSISFWAYVNTGTMSDGAYVRESNILNYANGRPKISYVNNGTHKGNKYIVYLSNSPNAEPLEVVLDDGHQKWNYFTIVYHDHSADLFVNGKLLRSANFNPLKGDEKDTIVVGSENGLKGAICNVSYFPYALTTREISTTYNVLRFKNPPTLG